MQGQDSKLEIIIRTKSKIQRYDTKEGGGRTVISEERGSPCYLLPLDRYCACTDTLDSCGAVRQHMFSYSPIHILSNWVF